jgi:hypothetical protein
LLKYIYPNVSDYNCKAIGEIAHHTREQMADDDAKLTSMISTRASVEMCGLVYDDFTLLEAAEISVFPLFSKDGGTDSERTYIKQLVQKYKEVEKEEKLFTSPSTSQATEDDDVPVF